MKHISIFVRGRVQGVFYRASTRDAARQFGVNGFVRNEPDGSVYIEASGDEVALEKLIAWCRKGPPRAMVSDIQISEMEGLVQFHSFEINR